MSTAPDPQEIHERAETEGRRRMQMPPLEQAATGFIAGVTVMFGIVALGLVAALLEPHFGREVAELGGALGFGVGLVFLVVGRSELFSESFFGPFDHVVVSVLHLLMGVWLGDVAAGAVAQNLALSTIGNLLGGLLSITLTHTAQVRSAERSEGRTTMRVLLAGGTGVIGRRAVVRQLVAAGHEVTAVSRTAEKDALLRSAGATTVRVSLFDPPAVRAAAEGHDAVVSLATGIRR